MNTVEAVETERFVEASAGSLQLRTGEPFHTAPVLDKSARSTLCGHDITDGGILCAGSACVRAWIGATVLALVATWDVPRSSTARAALVPGSDAASVGRNTTVVGSPGT